MKNGKFTRTILQMQYVPRWSEYAPRFKDNAASHSFRCAAVAVLVATIEEHICQNQIDKFQLVARALMHDLNETETGSIKHMTKKSVFVAEHIQTFEKEVSKEIVTYLSKSLRPHFYDFIVDAEDESYVGRLVDAIDAFDSMLFCQRENAYDSNPYFQIHYQQLHDKVQQSALPSIQWLLEEYDKREGFYEFMGYILNLDIIDRWNGNFNLIADNDAIHSFRVAALSLFNGLLELERFGKKDISMFHLLGKAIFHDVCESLGGDVKGNFKHSQPHIKAAFEMHEKEIARQMVLKLPAFLHADMTNFMVDSKDGTYEGELIDIADKLDALIKANLEMRNNPHYAETFYQQLTTIQYNYENPCVIFFLAYILHDLTYVNLMK